MGVLSAVPSVVAVLALAARAARIIEVDDGGGVHEESWSRPEERCNRLSRKPLKDYHFQLSLGDNKVNATSITLNLRRDPERPTWTIDVGASWTAWLPAPWFTSENDADLVWQSTGGVETHEVDAIEDISYFRRVRYPRGDDGARPPNGIVIHWSHGNASFAGGAYFPITVTKNSLNDLLRTELSDDDFNETSILLHGGGGSLPNETAAPSRDSMFGCKAQELTQSLTSLQTIGSPLFSVALGAVSVASGTVTSSIVGTIESGIQGIRSLDQFFDDRRQANYAASEKFFDKMWCHSLFTQCQASNGDDIAVPPGKECPDV